MIVILESVWSSIEFKTYHSPLPSSILTTSSKPLSASFLSSPSMSPVWKAVRWDRSKQCHKKPKLPTDLSHIELCTQPLAWHFVCPIWHQILVNYKEISLKSGRHLFIILPLNLCPEEPCLHETRSKITDETLTRFYLGQSRSSGQETIAGSKQSWKTGAYLWSCSTDFQYRRPPWARPHLSTQIHSLHKY